MYSTPPTTDTGTDGADDPASAPARPREPAPGWSDVNAFQRDVLLAIADLGDGDPYGRQIRERLERTYGEPVGESRLYQALDDLADLDLVQKRRGTIDARTNYYSLTADAVRLLRAHARRCVDVLGVGDRRHAANP